MKPPKAPTSELFKIVKPLHKDVSFLQNQNLFRLGFKTRATSLIGNTTRKPRIHLGKTVLICGFGRGRSFKDGFFTARPQNRIEQKIDRQDSLTILLRKISALRNGTGHFMELAQTITKLEENLNININNRQIEQYEKNYEPLAICF